MKPANVFERVGHALQEVGTAFEKAAIAVSAERLHDANVNIGVVIAQEGFAIYRDEVSERAKVVVKKVLAEFGRQVGLSVEEQRGDVVLQRAFAPTLVVYEIGLAVAQHDVAGLKIAIEKIVAWRFYKKIPEAVEVVFESVFVEGNPR